MSDVASTSGPSELQLQQAVRVAIAATERGDYPGAMKLFKVVYDDRSLKPPVEGLSFYGLCVAIEDKQTKKGTDLCRAAISAQFYDSRHYANLIQLHLKKNNRKAAVEVLEEALGRLPKDALLLKVREQMGFRAPPPIRFLSRDNVLNRVLQRRKGEKGEKKTQRKYLSFGNIHPVVGFFLVLLFLASVFGLTFFVLYRQAYGG